MSSIFYIYKFKKAERTFSQPGGYAIALGDICGEKARNTPFYDAVEMHYILNCTQTCGYTQVSTHVSM